MYSFYLKRELDILNKEIKSDYYLVFDGDIIEYEIPSFFNFFEFSLTYEISIVIYNNIGDKVFSKHYKQNFHRIPESHMDANTYYDYLSKTIFLYADTIDKDLKAVILNSGKNKIIHSASL